MSIYRRLGKKLLRGLRRARLLPPVSGDPQSREGSARGTIYERGVAAPSQSRGGASRAGSITRAAPNTYTPAEVFVDNLAAITRLGSAGFGTRRKALGTAVIVAGISIGIAITGAAPKSSQTRIGAARGATYERGISTPSQVRVAASRAVSRLAGSARASQSRPGASRGTALERGLAVPHHNRSGSSRVASIERAAGIQAQIRIGASRVVGLERAGATASHRRNGSALVVAMERATGIQGQVRVGASKAQAMEAAIPTPSHRRSASSRAAGLEGAVARPSQSRIAASRASPYANARATEIQLRAAWSVAPSYAVTPKRLQEVRGPRTIGAAFASAAGLQSQLRAGVDRSLGNARSTGAPTQSRIALSFAPAFSRAVYQPIFRGSSFDVGYAGAPGISSQVRGGRSYTLTYGPSAVVSTLQTRKGSSSVASRVRAMRELGFTRAGQTYVFGHATAGALPWQLRPGLSMGQSSEGAGANPAHSRTGVDQSAASGNAVGAPMHARAGRSWMASWSSAARTINYNATSCAASWGAGFSKSSHIRAGDAGAIAYESAASKALQERSGEAWAHVFSVSPKIDALAGVSWGEGFALGGPVPEHLRSSSSVGAGSGNASAESLSTTIGTGRSFNISWASGPGIISVTRDARAQGNAYSAGNPKAEQFRVAASLGYGYSSPATITFYDGVGHAYSSSSVASESKATGAGSDLALSWSAVGDAAPEEYREGASPGASYSDGGAQAETLRRAESLGYAYTDVGVVPVYTGAGDASSWSVPVGQSLESRGASALASTYERGDFGITFAGDGTAQTGSWETGDATVDQSRDGDSSPIGFVSESNPEAEHFRIAASLGSGYVSLTDVAWEGFATTKTTGSAGISAVLSMQGMQIKKKA